MPRPLSLPKPPTLPDFVRQAQAATATGKISDALQSGRQGGDSFLSQLQAGPLTSSGDTSQLGGGLVGVMAEQVRGVNTMQNDAHAMLNSLLTGGDVNEAEVLTSIQKADLAFRMLMQIRNKLMDAYREVQQIQI